MKLEVFGLVLNFSGALAIAIASGIQTELNFNHLKMSMNYPGSAGGLVENAVQKNLRHIRIMSITRWIIYVGYLLFILGFGLQLKSTS